MDVNLYVKNGEGFKVLKVPHYVIKDLLRDRLSKSELDRIDRLAEKTKTPKIFKSGSVVIDFSNKSAQCFHAGINIKELEPTWNVQIEEVNLNNY